VAEAGNADLIVVGSRGHSLVREVVLGGVPIRLPQIAHRPVLVVPVSDRAAADLRSSWLAPALDQQHRRDWRPTASKPQDRSWTLTDPPGEQIAQPSHGDMRQPGWRAAARQTPDAPARYGRWSVTRARRRLVLLSA
jgi:hypothetical protein